MILLDTHVLVWAVTQDRKLGRKVRITIDRQWELGRVAVCAVTFWEIALLQGRNRLRLPLPARQWRAELLSAGLMEIPIDGESCVRAADLTGFPDDPADRMIAATALHHGATLLTADERILVVKHTLPRQDARG